MGHSAAPAGLRKRRQPVRGLCTGPRVGLRGGEPGGHRLGGGLPLGGAGPRAFAAGCFGCALVSLGHQPHAALQDPHAGSGEPVEPRVRRVGDGPECASPLQRWAAQVPRSVWMMFAWVSCALGFAGEGVMQDRSPKGFCVVGLAYGFVHMGSLRERGRPWGFVPGVRSHVQSHRAQEELCRRFGA